MKLNLFFKDGTLCDKDKVSSKGFKEKWAKKEILVLTNYNIGKFKVKKTKKTDA